MEFIRDIEVCITVDTNKQTHRLSLESPSIAEAKVEIEEFFKQFYTN